MNSAKRILALLSLIVGPGLTLTCFLLLVLQPKGTHEFGFAPFAPDGLPFSPMRGFSYEQLHSHAVRLLLLGPGLLITAWGWVAVRKPEQIEPAQISDGFFRKLAIVAALFSVAWLGVTLVFLVRGRALSDDELVYSMQAAALARGTISPPDVGFAPIDVFTVATPHGYTGKYMPGEPLVQMLGVKLGIAPLLHIPIAALLLLAWYRTLRRDFEPRESALACAALALCPSFILTSAIGLSQLTALACVVLCGLGLSWIRSDKPAQGAALLALASCYCFATRPQTAIPACGVLLVLASRELWQQRALRAALLGATLGAAGLLAIGAYNRAVTGSMFKLPWYLQCNPEHYGFGKVWACDTFRHNARTLLENLLVLGVRLNAWWLGLPLSFIVLFFVPRGSLVKLRPWLLIGLAVILFEALYYSTGVSDTGPLYHFELFLPGSLLVARALLCAWQRWPRHAPTFVVLHVLLGTGSFLLEHTLRLKRMADAIHDTAESVLAQLPKPAILIHELWWAESLRVGWVMDSFPERYRDPADPVVTMPRPPWDYLPQVLAAYPGRKCFYFHRDAVSEQPEVLPCEQAQDFLDRSLAGPNWFRTMWIAPTAYKKTSYNPQVLSATRNLPIAGCELCCVNAFRELYGEIVIEEQPCQP